MDENAQRGNPAGCWGVWPGAVRVDMNQELVIVKMQKKVGGSLEGDGCQG